MDKTTKIDPTSNTIDPTSPTHAHPDMQRMVTVTLPKAPEGASQAMYVGLNQKNYLIPRGKPVTIPEPVWHVIRMTMSRRERLEAALREVSHDH